MKTFLLEIITPERVAYSDQVEMVTVPSALGTMGILARHVNLFAQLVEGELKINKRDNEYYLSIGGGFVEVTDEKVMVLVTRATHATELNEREVLKAKDEAQRVLREKLRGTDVSQMHAILRQSLIDWRVLSRRKKRVAN